MSVPPRDIVAFRRDLKPRGEDVVARRVGQDITLRRGSRLDDDEFELIGIVINAIVAGTPAGTRGEGPSQGSD